MHGLPDAKPYSRALDGSRDRHGRATRDGADAIAGELFVAGGGPVRWPSSAVSVRVSALVARTSLETAQRLAGRLLPAWPVRTVRPLVAPGAWRSRSLLTALNRLMDRLGTSTAVSEDFHADGAPDPDAAGHCPRLRGRSPCARHGRTQKRNAFAGSSAPWTKAPRSAGATSSTMRLSPTGPSISRTIRSILQTDGADPPAAMEPDASMRDIRLNLRSLRHVIAETRSDRDRDPQCYSTNAIKVFSRRSGRVTSGSPHRRRRPG